MRFFRIMVLLAAFSLVSARAQGPYLRIYYPDIEQGASTLIVSPTGKALLIDGGTGLKDTDSPIESFINDLIDAGVVTSLDYVVSTHYDEDHIGRLENVFQLVPMAAGAITYDRGDFGGTPSTFAFNDYLWEANQQNRTTITPNTTIDLGGGVTVRCYVVNGDLPDGSSVDLSQAGQFENAASVGLVVRYGNFDTWIGGDLTDNPASGHPPVESSVAPWVGDVDIYTVDHHGSRATSSNATFLGVLKAEVAINQNSASNNFGHPSSDVVNRILSTGDSLGNTPLFFQSNPGDPDDTRSDDTLASGIADPDDVDGPGGLPGTITVISDGDSYQIYGGNIEPVTLAADSGPGTLADFPPALLQVSYSPLVPLASETVTVEAEIRDGGSFSALLAYSVDGVNQASVTMTQIGATQRYQGVIPAQSDGGKVIFHVEATDSSLSQTTKSYRTGYFSGTSDIADIRELNGDNVLLTKGFSARVEGNITAESGLFHPNVSQIYVQDATGGINIFDSTSLPLSRGDLVRFIGEIDQFGGVAQIVIAEDIGNYGYQFVSSGSAPTPGVFTLAQLGEAQEGLLVRVNDVTVVEGTIPVGANGNLTVTDDNEVTTFTIRIDKDTDIPGANTPTTPFDIIGLASQFDSSVPLDFGYQILPREKADFISEEVNHPVVVIHEIHADPDGTLGDANGDGTVSSTRDEFIELVNTSTLAVDISGYTLSDLIGVRFTFPTNTVLPPREAAVVFGGGNPSGDFGNAMANGLVFTAGSLGLNNSGDTITLEDDSSVLVQSISYGSEGGKNQSLVRDPDWTNSSLKKHTETAPGLRYSPGTRLDGTAFTVAAGALVLSEIMYDASGSDGNAEWIEIFNASDQTIDLSGVSIGAGGNDYTNSLTQLSGSVDSGETFVVGGPDSNGNNANPVYDLVLNFSPDLQNSGSTADGVALFNLPAAVIDATTVPIDAVIYGVLNSNGLIDAGGAVGTPNVADASSGSTIERTDLSGTWQIQGTPTPNATSLTQGGGPMGGPTDIIITEVFYDVSGSDNGFEWVELYNKGSLAVDLSGMSLGGGGNDYTTSTAQLSGTIQPGATLVVGGPTSSSANGSPTFDLVLNFSPDLQNSGSTADGVALFDVLATQITSATVPIDAVIYGGSNSNGLIDESGSANSPDVADAPAGSSIERTGLGGTWQVQNTPDPNGVSF